MMQNKVLKTKKIGLTGGIASGKSTVSAHLKHLGAYVIDADIVSREITKKGSFVLQKLKDELGKEIVDNDGNLNRPLVRNIVFNDAVMLKKLNKVIHPEIIREISSRIEDVCNKDIPVVVVDAALLIETGIYKKMDQVWLVFLEKQVQIERLMKRDNISYTDALNIIKSQMELEQKVKYADYIIDNNFTEEYTLKQTENLWNKVLTEVCGG
ncbi:MAG: dephospho-CoA kinase [Clostridia bacterium]|nr:dephospho-CoA kinase [Clostridia bacterium]